MLNCCQNASAILSINVVESVANIIIASLTLLLGYYVFFYQNKENKKNELKSLELKRKSIKLEWFKELIIQPKFQLIIDFFDKLNGIENKINSNDLSEEERIEIINFIKKEQSIFRKSFLDLIQALNYDLYDQLIKNLDNLTDNLTISISNDELKLNNKKVYDREIKLIIKETNHKFLSIIFSYEGN